MTQPTQTHIDAQHDLFRLSGRSLEYINRFRSHALTIVSLLYVEENRVEWEALAIACDRELERRLTINMRDAYVPQH